jgi:CheY-like chemotaxis protein
MQECTDPLRLMLVDDTEALRFALGRVLRLYGFDVREACDGREALEQLAEFRPQVVLTDLMMPGMDGVELIRTLQKAPATSGIPIVALTANTTDEARDSAREAGAVEVMAKPVDLPQLVERLRELPRSAATMDRPDLSAFTSAMMPMPGLGTVALCAKI